MRQHHHLQLATKENIVKNAAIVVLTLVLYPAISRGFSMIKPSETGDVLLIISILLVTACFAAFAFTYEKNTLAARWQRYLSHSVTFIFMLLIAVILESTVVVVRSAFPELHSTVLWFSVFLYVGVALYDFWNLFRAGV